MATKRKIFRDDSIDQISSPEQLDHLMTVTRSRGWLALAALCGLLAILTGWSVVGRVSTQIVGQGILLKRGGVLDVVAPASGHVEALLVQANDEVKAGEVVARIAQPELAARVESTRARLEEVRKRNAKLAKLGTTDVTLERSYLAEQRETQRRAIESDRRRVAFLRDQLAKQEDLVVRGLLTKPALEATRQEISLVEKSIRDARAELRGLSVSSQKVAGRQVADDISTKMQQNDLERELALLEARLEQSTRVVSAQAGRVLEVKVSLGEVVGPGRAIFSVEPEGEGGRDLYALVYVPLQQGKVLEPGMRARIAPASVRREEHGMLVAKIVSVSRFPSTADGMRRILKNDQLVDHLVSRVGLAPVAVRIELETDSDTASGFAWTSREGPPVELGAGTPCVGEILVSESRPIARAFPAIGRLLADDAYAAEVTK